MFLLWKTKRDCKEQQVEAGSKVESLTVIRLGCAQMNMLWWAVEPWKLLEYLHVPDPLLHLVSVSIVSERGRVVRFVDKDWILATATKCGSLYFVDCLTTEQMHTAKGVWHRRYGILEISRNSWRDLSVALTVMIVR